MVINFLIALIGYLIGSIPMGYLIAKWHGIEDIRSFGSGNTGATNVSRALGIKYFFIVFFLDAFKSYAFLRFLGYCGVADFSLFLAAFALMIGNGASIFLQFKGGKGIATSAGILLALDAHIFFVMLGLWLGVLAASRTVGFASVVILLAGPLIAFYCNASLLMFYFICFLTCWGLYLHRENIARYWTAGI